MLRQTVSWTLIALAGGFCQVICGLGSVAEVKDACCSKYEVVDHHSDSEPADVPLDDSCFCAGIGNAPKVDRVDVVQDCARLFHEVSALQLRENSFNSLRYVNLFLEPPPDVGRSLPLLI